MREDINSPNYESEEYRLDDLQTDGMKIYQNPADFCFGTDAVLLADFASKAIRKNSSVIDLCTGNGIIPILLHARRKDLKISAVEIDAAAAALAAHNMKLNQIEDRIDVICSDIKDLPKQMYGTFDAVSVNPPYIAVGKGLLSGTDKMSSARHEIHAELEDIIRISSRLLKDKGKLFMVHRPHRTAEIIRIMERYDMEPKVIRFVHSNTASKANLLLISAAKKSGSWLDIMPPLFLYRADGSYTKELDEIYGRDHRNEI